MSTCHRFAPLLSVALDGKLDRTELDRLEAHLAVCTRCRIEMERLLQARGRLASYPRFETPAGFEARVLSAAIAQSQRTAWPLQIEGWLARPAMRLCASLTTALGLALLAWVANDPRPSPVPPPSRMATVDVIRAPVFYAGMLTRPAPPDGAARNSEPRKEKTSWHHDSQSPRSQRSWS